MQWSERRESCQLQGTTKAKYPIRISTGIQILNSIYLRPRVMPLCSIISSICSSNQAPILSQSNPRSTMMSRVTKRTPCSLQPIQVLTAPLGRTWPLKVKIVQKRGRSSKTIDMEECLEPLNSSTLTIHLRKSWFQAWRVWMGVQTRVKHRLTQSILGATNRCLRSARTWFREEANCHHRVVTLTVWHEITSQHEILIKRVAIVWLKSTKSYRFLKNDNKCPIGKRRSVHS